MQVTRSRLKEIILEELSLIERGFGEGEPPEGELYKKQEKFMEESDEVEANAKQVLPALEEVPGKAESLAKEVMEDVKAYAEKLPGFEPKALLSLISAFLMGDEGSVALQALEGAPKLARDKANDLKKRAADMVKDTGLPSDPILQALAAILAAG